MGGMKLISNDIWFFTFQRKQALMIKIIPSLLINKKRGDPPVLRLSAIEMCIPFMCQFQISFEISLPPIGQQEKMKERGPTRGMKLVSNDIWWRHLFQCNRALSDVSPFRWFIGTMGSRTMVLSILLPKKLSRGGALNMPSQNLIGFCFVTWLTSLIYHPIIFRSCLKGFHHICICKSHADRSRQLFHFLNENGKLWEAIMNFHNPWKSFSSWV